LSLSLGFGQGFVDDTDGDFDSGGDGKARREYENRVSTLAP
jgi:hypothetical protein